MLHVCSEARSMRAARRASTAIRNDPGLKRSRPCHASSAAKGTVLLTREAGKNGALQSALRDKGIESVEVPMVATGPGRHTELLADTLQTCTFDWVVVTSPEAARVLVEAWLSCAYPPVLRLAPVGTGTARVIKELEPTGALHIAFQPSKANAVTLAAELPSRPQPLPDNLAPPQPSAGAASTPPSQFPTSPASDAPARPPLPPNAGVRPSVLYPASQRAASTLQDGLKERGFDVRRLDTYTTEPVTAVTPEELKTASSCAVVSIASPSALKAWVEVVGVEPARRSRIACIGQTSGAVALRMGFSKEQVFWPDDPGLDGFVSSVEEALVDRDSAAVERIFSALRKRQPST